MEVSSIVSTVPVLLYNELSVRMLTFSVTRPLFFEQVFALVTLFRIFPVLRHMANGILSMIGRRVSENPNSRVLRSTITLRHNTTNRCRSRGAGDFLSFSVLTVYCSTLSFCFHEMDRQMGHSLFASCRFHPSLHYRNW
jgi:hypothetical protein